MYISVCLYYIYTHRSSVFLSIFCSVCWRKSIAEKEEQRDIITREILEKEVKDRKMGSVPPELSLDFAPSFVPKTITDFLRELSMIGSVSERALKLDDFVKRLEEEMGKIDAFKRELPLCMILLNDGWFWIYLCFKFSFLRNGFLILDDFDTWVLFIF